VNLREAIGQALDVLDIPPFTANLHDFARVNSEAAHILRQAYSEPEQEFVCSTGLCRFRKPLTDEEIELLAVKHAPPIDPAFAKDDDFIEFARAVERAHGIGGEA
jgi:hypothetical protein